MTSLKAILASSLLISFSVYADFDKGGTAFEQQNYEIAFSEFTESATKGDAKSQRIVMV
jgi:hypothetical protein